MDQTQDDFASVDADANLDCWPSGRIARTATERIAYRDCGVHRPLGMVLVRHRCAEQRENAVAGRLHDIAAVMADGLNHNFERGINEGAGGLRVEITHQLS
jgi:hypothetical protein